MESLLSPAMEFKGRQSRLNLEPYWTYGRVHVGLDRLDEPAGDWPWLQDVIQHLEWADDEVAPERIRPLDRLTRGWHRDDEEGWVDSNDFQTFYSEEQYLSACGISGEEDRSYGAFVWRLAEALRAAEPSDAHRALLFWLLPIVLRSGDLQLSVQPFEHGDVDVLWDPHRNDRQGIELILNSWESHVEGGLAGQMITAIRDIDDQPRPLFRLGRFTHQTLGAAALPSLNVVRIGDRFDDPALALDRTLDRIKPTGERWFSQSGEGLRVAPWLQAAVGRLERAANEAAPSFVTERGTIRFGIEPLGGRTHDPSSVVALEPHGAEHAIEWGELGAGTRRWVAVAVETVCTPPPSAAPSSGRWTSSPLYLIDEPELHLHPLAQRSIRDWIEQRVNGGAIAIVATHSASFLDTELQAAHLVGVVRAGAQTVLFQFSHDPLSVVAPAAGELLGLDRSAAVALTRGILIVEGEHDRRVIDAFFSEDTARARIRVQPIRGTNEAMSIADAELYALLGVPLCVVFDEVLDTNLLGNPDRRLSQEERKLRNLLEHTAGSGFAVTYAPFELPDIIAALPESAVRRAFPHARPNDWTSIIDSWRQLPEKNRPGFKPYALRQLAVDDTPDHFVARVLAAVVPDDRPAPALARAMSTALAHLGRVPPSAALGP